FFDLLRLEHLVQVFIDPFVLDIAENEAAFADLKVRRAFVGNALGLVLDLDALLGIVCNFLEERLERGAVGMLGLVVNRRLAKGPQVALENILIGHPEPPWSDATQMQVAEQAQASPIHLPPMADRHHQHDKAVILDGGDDAVIADAIAPESLEVAAQGMAESPRVLRGGDALPQISQNRALRRDAELAQLAGGVAVEFDAPARRHPRLAVFFVSAC